MKKTLFIALLGLVLLISCKKNTTSTQTFPDPKLKTIISDFDTITPLCLNCPPEISQKAEHFSYDNLDRLTTRIHTRSSRVLNSPITIDTSEIYSYSYSGNNSTITGYSHKSSNTIAYHILTYDSQNRLIRDSITNPQVGNDKLTSFTYFQNTIIQNERQSFIVGVETKIDTMTISGNNVVKEKIRRYTTSGSYTTTDLVYSISAYRNPLSYVNNFSLLASDYKNGTGSTLFTIYNPQYITYDLTTQTQVNSSSQYTTLFTATLDSLNRVKSFSNSSNGNKITTFEYY